jgi:hypothetical protein
VPGGPSPPSRDRTTRPPYELASFPFAIERRQKLVSGTGGFLVVQRSRIERHRTTHEFRSENPLLVVWQRFEGLEELSRLVAHNTRLAPFRERHKYEGKHRSGGRTLKALRDSRTPATPHSCTWSAASVRSVERRQTVKVDYQLGVETSARILRRTMARLAARRQTPPRPFVGLAAL